VVVIVGGGEIKTTAELDLEVSATEVAVTVMRRLPDTDAGALYIAVVAVVLEKLPQASPVTPVPEALQVTPLLLESFCTLAVNFRL
jgi:hypothetical protein